MPAETALGEGSGGVEAATHAAQSQNSRGRTLQAPDVKGDKKENNLQQTYTRHNLLYKEAWFSRVFFKLNFRKKSKKCKANDYCPYRYKAALQDRHAGATPPASL